MDYQKLFLQRWKELENEIELEKEDGETSFLEKDIFFKFFTSPELLVGYYVWRESGNLLHTSVIIHYQYGMRCIKRKFQKAIRIRQHLWMYVLPI